ncbi:hypothetical protein [Paludibacterium sp.]|nr:hypothetical protein [Paludibacterium sp.]MBV8646134.1 hypothetical protein [Paludibacterium sp.]
MVRQDDWHCHLPVVDEVLRVVGMVSQSDLLACALSFLAYRAHAPRPG